MPSGVQSILDQATAWFLANTPAVCFTHGTCGTQFTWTAILEQYNFGCYPQPAPYHCSIAQDAGDVCLTPQ